MAIGNQPTSNMQLNQQAAQIALQLRALMTQIDALDKWVNQQGQTELQALGFTGPDASQFITMCNYMATISGVYRGTVQQGGTGGTGAGTFDFADALVALTGPT